MMRLWPHHPAQPPKSEPMPLEVARTIERRVTAADALSCMAHEDLMRQLEELTRMLQQKEPTP